MLRCPERNDGKHPAPEKNQFVLLATIRVDPEFKFRRVQDHFLEDVLCETCGEPAEGVWD